MIKRKKLISSIVAFVMIVISVLSALNAWAEKDQVFFVSSKGETVIQAESCSDYVSNIEQYLKNSYISFNAGNWMDYYLDVEKGGSYLVTTYVARKAGDGNVNFTVTIDGEQAKTSLIPDTTGWLDFGACELFEMEIPEGRHTIRFTITSSGCHFDRFSLKRIEEFKVNTDYKNDEGPYRNLYVPSIIEAEDFDMGQSGVVSSNGINDGGQYRKDAALDIYAIRPSGNYVSLAEGEAANYTLDVTAKGVYALSLIMGTGEASVYLNSHPEALKVTSNAESGFSEVFAGNILLDAGKYILTLKNEAKGVAIDSFRFKPATEGEYYTEKHFETGFVEKKPEPTEAPSVATPEPTAEPTVAPTPEPDPFTDISGHWAYNNIKKATKAGIIKGYPDGTFKPQNTLSIKDAFVLAMRAANLSFSESHPYNAAVKYGLVVDENIDRDVTREEFAKIIVSALSYENGQVTGKYKPGAFSDEDEIGIEYLVYAHGARTMSLMTGDENKAFRPKANLTRAEAATILTRIS